MMKRVIIILTIFLLIFATGCSHSEKSEKIKIAATIFPIYDFVKNIGGDYIEPVLIVSPGESPHTFSPTIQDVKNISGARAVFINGFGLDDWISKLAKSAGITRVISVNTELQDVVKSHNGNPHLWLNPEYAVKECGVIAETLSQVDPVHKEYYSNNYKEYTDKILQAGLTLKKDLSNLQNRNFVAFHPAYEYFAEYFGLNEVAVIEKVPGQKPTPKDIISIEKLIKNGKVKVLFKEPQLSSDIVDSMAEDTGMKVETFDPLGGVDGRDSYIKLLTYDAKTVKKVLEDE
jgi:zinc transport system substrate-binding protein